MLLNPLKNKGQANHRVTREIVGRRVHHAVAEPLSQRSIARYQPQYNDRFPVLNISDSKL